MTSESIHAPSLKTKQQRHGICAVCSSSFTWWATSSKKKLTCSIDCYNSLNKSLRKREHQVKREERGECDKPCEICGSPVKDKRSRACSSLCGGQLALRSKEANGIVLHREMCLYSPESHRDFQFMLAIMHRKGFIEGNPAKAHRYEIIHRQEGEANQVGQIKYRDLPPHPLSDDGRMRALEKLQEHGDGVEQAGKEEGANPSTLQELREGKETWAASIEKAMGWRTTSWQ